MFVPDLRVALFCFEVIFSSGVHGHQTLDGEKWKYIAPHLDLIRR